MLGLNCHAQDFEVCAEEKRAGAEKRASGERLMEIGAIDGVETIEEGDVRAENLEHYQILEREICFG